MKRYQKILLGVLATLTIAVGGIQIYFSFFLDNDLKATFITRFNTATNSAYNLDIGEFDLRVFGRQLRLENVKISTKPDSVDHKLQASLDALTVKGIGFLPLLVSQKLSLREIEVTDPSVHFTAPQKQDTDNRQQRLTDYSQRLSEITLEVLKNVKIPHLVVRGLSVTYNRPDFPANNLLSFKDSDIRLYDIAIDSTLIKDKRVLPADNITAVIRDIQMKTANELYEISADRLHFNSDSQQLNMRSIKFIPQLSKQAFAHRLGHEADRIAMTIDEINCRRINTSKLNRAEQIEAQHISVQKPDIDIYRDKRPPFPPNNRPPLPRQMIRSIPFPVDIDTVLITEGNIRYSEHVPKADKAGFVTFADLKAEIYPLSNLEQQQPITLTAQTNIMDQAKLQAHFTFPANTNNQHIKGTLQSMDMTSLNKALVPMAFVRIDEGRIMDMDFEIKLNEKRSKGTVMLRYKDLKVSLLNKETSEENFGDKLKSLLANTFAVKSSNTGDEPRTGNINFERDPQKSVFNYWWKSLLSGLKSSLGL